MNAVCRCELKQAADKAADWGPWSWERLRHSRPYSASVSPLPPQFCVPLDPLSFSPTQTSAVFCSRLGHPAAPRSHPPSTALPRFHSCQHVREKVRLKPVLLYVCSFLFFFVCLGQEEGGAWCELGRVGHYNRLRKTLHALLSFAGHGGTWMGRRRARQRGSGSAGGREGTAWDRECIFFTANIAKDLCRARWSGCPSHFPPCFLSWERTREKNENCDVG